MNDRKHTTPHREHTGHIDFTCAPCRGRARDIFIQKPAMVELSVWATLPRDCVGQAFPAANSARDDDHGKHIAWEEYHPTCVQCRSEIEAVLEAHTTDNYGNRQFRGAWADVVLYQIKED